MYKCRICNYIAHSRSQLHEHHIKPKEQNGSDIKYNKVMLCPNCHSRVYISTAKKGIHSKKVDNSIIIYGWVNFGLLLKVEIDNEIKYI